jgi:crotonobetainyl-CoA:carnitine CoA-transferase CaiB-like acyl-CoA transferase
MRPLDGLVVLDLSRLLPGAAATMQLANFGAQVIKIEEPERGDYGRWRPPYLDGEGAVFRMVNRGKQSVALDLKSDGGRQALLKLAASADVLVESFRPGTMQRLDLGYETLHAHNERLIYVSITGYGQDGPWAGMAGHDINYLALGGALDLNGAAGGPPAIPGIQIADLAGGAMQAVTGVLLALAARAKTGRGQAVDVSMLDGVAWMLPVELGFYAATGQTPTRGDGVLTGRYACYRVYQTADGRWIAVGALEPKFWQALCRALGCEQLIAGQFEEGPRREEIIAELARIFHTRTAGEWFERLQPADVCVTPVRNVAEVAAHFGLGPGDSVVTPRLSDTPGRLGGPPPRLGEQTREVLGTDETN